MAYILPVIFNFALVLGILYFSCRKAFAAFLINRSKDIGTQIQDAEKLYSESHAFLIQSEADSKASEAHAKRLLDDAKVTLERVRTTSLEKAKHEAERVSKEASMVGKTELARARMTLQKELAQKSLSAAEGYLTSHMNDEDRHGLVNNYVETVGNGHAG